MSFTGVWEAVQNGWEQTSVDLQTDTVLSGHDISIFFIIFILPSYSTEELLEPGDELRNVWGSASERTENEALIR
ncbi:hypothetical protein AV530_014530 [Patagioenas fasciata monilis]|uniref:Uncharacterized protein n=1 Tax=Patagioenas fasciata monilis TaxID=372326 RepID=A0A1V4KCB0_PATFA|nr:hypothetical protein AV530_014530 [Patagioenas fasciata monilis]